MSLLKDLQNITESEKTTLQELLLGRVEELEDKKLELLENFNENHPKIQELNSLIKFSNYLFHWIEDPPTEYLQ